jgi:hypothetical protein
MAIDVTFGTTISSITRLLKLSQCDFQFEYSKTADPDGFLVNHSKRRIVDGTQDSHCSRPRRREARQFSHPLVVLFTSEIHEPNGHLEHHRHGLESPKRRCMFLKLHHHSFRESGCCRRCPPFTSCQGGPACRE